MLYVFCHFFQSGVASDCLWYTNNMTNISHNLRRLSLIQAFASVKSQWWSLLRKYIFQHMKAFVDIFSTVFRFLIFRMQKSKIQRCLCIHMKSNLWFLWFLYCVTYGFEIFKTFFELKLNTHFDFNFCIPNA